MLYSLLARGSYLPKRYMLREEAHNMAAFTHNDGRLHILSSGSVVLAC
jgi:hypothetical protein